MKKLFVSKKVVAVGTAIQIIFKKAPYIQYEQILLDKNFRQYLETVMVSKKILRMGTQKTPMQKTYEINMGQDSIDAEFLGANRQFDWLEISLVHDKSDTHAQFMTATIEKWLPKKIKSLPLTNFTEVYSLTNEKKITMSTI